MGPKVAKVTRSFLSTNLDIFSSMAHFPLYTRHLGVFWDLYNVTILKTL